MRTAIFYIITQKVLETAYGRFGITYRSHLQGLRIHFCPLKMGPIGCPETSVTNYHYSLPNRPEEHSSYLLRGRGLKSCICVHVHNLLICAVGCLSGNVSLRNVGFFFRFTRMIARNDLIRLQSEYRVSY